MTVTVAVAAVAAAVAAVAAAAAAATVILIMMLVITMMKMIIIEGVVMVCLCEVSNAAVDELCRAAARPRRKVFLLH